MPGLRLATDLSVTSSATASSGSARGSPTSSPTGATIATGGNGATLKSTLTTATRTCGRMISARDGRRSPFLRATWIPSTPHRRASKQNPLRQRSTGIHSASNRVPTISRTHGIVARDPFGHSVRPQIFVIDILAAFLYDGRRSRVRARPSRAGLRAAPHRAASTRRAILSRQRPDRVLVGAEPSAVSRERIAARGRSARR